VLATNRFKRIPDQRFDEQLCIPSQVLDYLRFVADPAAIAVIGGRLARSRGS
jgi:hypothetical protein